MKNFEDMYNRLDTIQACDIQTDIQTSCHGIVRAMHTRRAVMTQCARPAGMERKDGECVQV